VSRLGTVLLSLVAIGSAMYIGSIEGAWKALAAIGAGLAAPTVLRWLWWRINAAAELLAIAAGLGSWLVMVLVAPGIAHAAQLLITGGVSGVVCVGVALLFAPTAADTRARFVARVQPLGQWPGPQAGLRRRAFVLRAGAFLGLLAAVYATLFAGRELFFGSAGSGVGLGLLALVAAVAGWAGLRSAVAVDRDLEGVSS
jgi:hypothetical protein